MNNIDVLLINPPSDLNNVLGSAKVFLRRFEPLGLLYIAAVLRENGFAVKIIDCDIEGIDFEKLKQLVIGISPKIIGITVLTFNGDVVYSLGKWLKQNHADIKIVLGNIHASAYSKLYLEHKCCDYVIHGEGEYAFLELAKKIFDNKLIDNLDGISYLGNNKKEVKYFSRPLIIDDLSKLPLPARDLLKQNLYNVEELSIHSYTAEKGTCIKSMLTSRGCPNNCLFCERQTHSRPRCNSVEKVVQEMELLEKQYHASFLHIMDPSFVANNIARVKEMAQLYQNNKLNIRWTANIHVNFITKELVYNLERAGCYEIAIGIESGVQCLLDGVRKNTTLNGIMDAVNTIKNNSDIKIIGLFMLGLPGESYNDSLKTINFAKKLNIDSASFAICTPFPGTDLFEKIFAEDKTNIVYSGQDYYDISVWKRFYAFSSFKSIKPIWTNGLISPDQLNYLQRKALREFYFRPKYILKNLFRIRFSNIYTIVKFVFTYVVRFSKIFEKK